jgi:hypothetical protein
MANWAAFAKTLGMAQHGDELRAHEKEKLKERNEAEELGFRRDANTRAGAAEGRESELANYRKTRRGAQEQAEAAALEGLGIQNAGGKIRNSQGQNELDVFNATGGASGNAARLQEDRARLDAAEKREAARLGISQEQLKIQKQEMGLRTTQEARLAAQQAAQEGRESAMHNERITGAQRENRIGAATEASDIQVGNDRTKIKDAQKLNSLVTLYRSLDPESPDAQYILEQIKVMTAEGQSAGQGSSATGGSAPPQAGRPSVKPNYAQDNKNRMGGL